MLVRHMLSPCICLWVRLSECQSVTSRSSTKMAKCIGSHKQRHMIARRRHLHFEIELWLETRRVQRNAFNQNQIYCQS